MQDNIISPKEILPEDMTDEMRLLADIIGFDTVILLSQNNGGEQIYIQKYDSLCKAARNRKIKSEFTGVNVRRLAQKYNLSRSCIREILGTQTYTQKGLFE